ncbi:AfsR/SARP family transcriptional regulator [Pedococcus sp. 5OH_020]|uniref:AfsR/SARP family transcriptional regulator n=1 Tax=Pedococcus sp. 5OH_020 TaxID=2989814 RepID=UPI0022E9F1EB|nr:BTAD domain-containing putative transcriptional regulator [Pedococcus sp. 5OH_020]
MSRLRRALGDPAVLRGDDAGYTLLLGPSEIDAVAVLQMAENATGLRAAAHPEAALEVCEQGLRLFHGDVLPGAAEAQWADPYRVRVETARLQLIEERLAAKGDLGAAEELIAPLEELTLSHPLRERLWALLVIALYRSGRQGDALAACRRVRHLLADELGIHPGPELQRVEQQVLAQDRSLAPRPSPVATGPRRGNLSTPVTSLVGRHAQLAQVVHALAEHQVVTLTGPAGVGKTRLAVEVASRSGLPAGAWLARLETATDPASVWRSIGEALAVDAPTEAAVTERLKGVKLLLVLDNCEHVVVAVSATVNTLLASAPHVRVLATSQVPLRAASETIIDLEPLTLTDSISLFTDRAEAQRRDQPDDQDSRATIEALCRSLDGLPLAIELAAARTKVLPVRRPIRG